MTYGPRTRRVQHAKWITYNGLFLFHNRYQCLGWKIVIQIALVLENDELNQEN